MPLKRSFPPVANAATRLLICGSLPGERSLAEQRYYAHPQNQFWRLMSAVIGRDLVALDYDARLAALLAAHIGLWDVVASANRTGSTDATIRDHRGNDLAALAIRLPALRAVAFNGATAAKLGTTILQCTGLKLIALPSSSPLHTVGLEAKLAVWIGLRTWN